MHWRTTNSALRMRARTRSHDEGPEVAAALNLGWLAAGLLGLALVSGCGSKDAEDLRMAATPSEAAGQLDSAFSSAPAEFRRAAEDASAALRSDDLNRAVESLSALRGSEGVTLQQGVAVHSSLVLLEARLIAASEAGDPKAREAYALLKRMKQK